MTTLAYLPEVSGPQVVATNEDWTGALTFWWDAAFTQPVPLDGIDFTMTVRTSPTDPNVYFQGSTDDGSLSVLAAGAFPTIGSGGTGYAVGDVFKLQGGTALSPATFKVTGQTGGAVTSVAMLSAGDYETLPSNPVSTVASTGSGSGLTLALAWVNNAIAVTIPKESFPDTLVAGGYVYELRAADTVNVRVIASGALTVTQGVVRP